MTFLVMSLAVVILSAIGLLASQARAVAVAGLILAAILVTMNAAIASTPIKPPYRGSLVEESESAYHYIQVLNDDGAYLLALNEGHAIHSIFDPANPHRRSVDYFAIAPLFLNESGGQLERSLIVGLAEAQPPARSSRFTQTRRSTVSRSTAKSCDLAKNTSHSTTPGSTRTSKTVAISLRPRTRRTI